jgi:hypothetical protein
MINAATELQNLVDEFVPRLMTLSQSEFILKPTPGKWSKQEVLGHLIDSAQNNIRRFICAQYERTPPKIRYDQDFWGGINDYQSMKKEDVIQLWRLINERICAVCINTSKERYSATSDSGGETPNLNTIEWLASDYVKHLKHHLNQIFAGSFDIVYP